MIALVAVAAATALAQYYQSEKARGASAKRLKELEAEFNQLVPPEYDVSVMDPPQYIQQAIPEPSFDLSTITPEQYKLVAKYKPEVAPMIAEQRPELVQETGGMKEGRQAQLDALRQLRRVSSEQGDPELAQALSQASQRSQIESQSRQQSILQDLARRGMMGSGAGLAAQMQGSSDAMGVAAASSQAAAAESYRNRLQSLRDSATLGGQIRDDDVSLQSKNNDVINSFNQRTSRARQDWENQRAGLLNDAQLRNIDAEQHVADENVQNRNKYALGDRDRRDALQKYLYDARSKERDTQNSIIGKKADWEREERDNQNKIKSQSYDDKYRKVTGSQGMAQMGINALSQATADKNQAIQGMGNAAMGGIQAYSDRQDRQSDQRAADDRAYYEKNGTWMSEEEKRKRYGDY